MGICIGKIQENNQIEIIPQKDNIINDVKNDDEDKLKKLENIDKTIPYFSFKGKKLKCRFCNIYDGDTFTIVFLYRNEIIKYRCRCLGYDTPEMKPSLKAPNREKEIEAAKKAKARFIELLEKGKDGIIEVECFEFDKYGRILVNVYNGIDNNSLNNIMIKEGHGITYDGGTKEKFNFD